MLVVNCVPKLLIVLFYVLFVCKCVVCYCHRVSTELHLTNISYHIDHLSYPVPGQCSLDWGFKNNNSNSHQVMFFVDIYGETASVTKVGQLCDIPGVLTL